MSRKLVATVTHYDDGRVEYINHFTGEHDVIEPGREVLLYVSLTGGSGCLTVGLLMLAVLAAVLR